MVYISKVYTKSGDDGDTGLGDGTRVGKDDARVEAMGTVDELNAVLGLLLAHDIEFSDRPFVMEICNDLFDLGADLSLPISNDVEKGKQLRVAEAQIQRLESRIDTLNEQLEPLTSFVLRGGTVMAAWCHFACTVCRRAERRLVALSKSQSVSRLAMIYLNRLSDYLFVLARTLNDGGRSDVLWQPGRGQTG